MCNGKCKCSVKYARLENDELTRIEYAGELWIPEREYYNKLNEAKISKDGKKHIKDILLEMGNKANALSESIDWYRNEYNLLDDEEDL